MKADLHIHTWCSTGTQTPEEVIKEAISKGNGLISITDDDTMWFYVDMDPGQGNYGWIEFSDVASKSPGCP